MRRAARKKPKQSQPQPSLLKGEDHCPERMPSASAKIEKLPSADAADPVKQFAITLEKKVRNLEKRKLKLDNYRNDVENGKELNEDQKIAVSKYDQVVELLEYSKELCKSLSAITQESTRIQKKLAKKEQIERQQHEIQRLQEAFCYKHILSCLENEDVRNDLLNGENGAPKVSAEDLAHLDHFYKLIGPSLPNDQADIESHFHALAENLIFLVEGKNKEVAGTTYKTLKEHLQILKNSGYFTKSSESAEDLSTDDMQEPEGSVESRERRLSEEMPQNGENTHGQDAEPCEVTDGNAVVESQRSEEVKLQETCLPPEADTKSETNYSNQNGSLQDVLASQGNFNFLQESQIGLDTPHMDPAVVAVHQVTPPSAMNFSQVTPQYAPQIQSPENLDGQMGNKMEHVAQQPPPPPMQVQPQPDQQQAQVPVMASAVQRNVPPVLASSIQHSDFDPSHPIPTQTYTNQSYAVMQHVIMPPGYVPVTMHHGPLPPHIAPIAVSLSPPVSTQANSAVVPMPTTVAPVAVSSATSSATELPEELSKGGGTENETSDEHLAMNGNVSGPETSAQNSGEKNEDSEGFTVQSNYQRGFRGRGRGRGTVGSYYRGRGGYSNRGSYQNHNYYQGSNFRRGSSRGRSSGNMRGGGRGSSNFRSQQCQQHQ